VVVNFALVSSTARAEEEGAKSCYVNSGTASNGTNSAGTYRICMSSNYFPTCSDVNDCIDTLPGYCKKGGGSH